MVCVLYGYIQWMGFCTVPVNKMVVKILTAVGLAAQCGNRVNAEEPDVTQTHKALTSLETQSAENSAAEINLDLSPADKGVS